MKVKIKDIIYDSELEPIMLIMDKTDKENISNMISTATKYCSYPEDSDVDEIKNFMKINDTK